MPAKARALHMLGASTLQECSLPIFRGDIKEVFEDICSLWPSVFVYSAALHLLLTRVCQTDLRAMFGQMKCAMKSSSQTFRGTRLTGG